MKHEVRAMQAQGSGNIINISSTYGHEGAAGASIYVGAKHAVEGRPIGTVVTRAALFSAVPVKRVNMPVSVGPGATAFTRIPDLASSSATDLVIDRLCRVGRSFIHHRPHTQRRWRQNPLAGPVRARSAIHQRPECLLTVLSGRREHSTDVRFRG
jgi:NAD(P)-dependent dehydrogenase (short-subunit alcohol dehydrogenase family)